LFDKYLNLESEMKENQRVEIENFITSPYNNTDNERKVFLKKLLLKNKVHSFPFNAPSVSEKILFNDAPLSKNALLGLSRMAVNLPSLQSQYIFCLLIFS
jgi:hypothetical protein